MPQAAGGEELSPPCEMLPPCRHHLASRRSCLVNSQISATFPWPQMVPWPQTGTGTMAPLHSPPFLLAWRVFQPLHMSYTHSFMNLKLIIFPACQKGTPVLCACFTLHVLRPQWTVLSQQEIYEGACARGTGNAGHSCL